MPVGDRAIVAQLGVEAEPRPGHPLRIVERDIGERRRAHQIQHDPAHDRQTGTQVDEAVQRRSDHVGDVPAAVAGTLDHQRARAGARGGDGSSGAGAPRADDEHVGLGHYPQTAVKAEVSWFVRHGHPPSSYSGAAVKMSRPVLAHEVLSVTV